MQIDRKVSAKVLSTYMGGGTVERLYLPENEDEFVGEYDEDAFVIGGGSKVIIADGNINKKVIKTSLLQDVKIQDDFVFAMAGTKVSTLINKCRLFQLGGLEFLSGIRATVGGIASMNAGAFNHETKDYIYKVKVLSGDCVKWLDAKDIDFGYRKGVNGVVIEVVFKLDKVDKTTSIELAKHYIELRRKTQPNMPSVGSVFKGADKPSGWYIDKCNLKGYKVGGAMISPIHANFIVNVGDGSADDYFALANMMKNAVYENFGITLQKEYKVLDENIR